MIQRIQTVYLFIGFLLMLFVMFKPLAIMPEANQTLEPFFYKTVIEGRDVSKTVFPLGLVAFLSASLNLLAIFFFKNNKQRLIQIRITTLSMLLAIGFYIAFGLYFYFLDFQPQSTEFSYTLIFPALAAVLDFMAISAIKKDIEKVKSADRLR